MTTTAGCDAASVAEGWKWVACPLCGATESVEIFEAKCNLAGEDGSAFLRQCGCGLCLTNPQPLQPSAVKACSEKAPSGSDDNLPALAKAQLWGPLSGVRGMLERCTDIARFQSRVAPEWFPTSNGLRVLIVTDRSEDLAPVCTASGMTVTHLQPTEMGIGALTPASLAELGDQRFDRIIIRHVLEHIPEPVLFLRGLRERMKDDGLMLISVPNVEAFQAKVFGEKWAGYNLPCHLWHFSAETLSRAATLAGLRAKGVKTVELAGLSEDSLKNLPADRMQKVRRAKWSARAVEKIGAGAEVVGVFSVERRAGGGR